MQYSAYEYTSQPQPTIINSVDFTDLTHIQASDRARWEATQSQRRSNTSQDKEAASNMRIRRRAQNRASQRAFRERKEKHVQHLEHELEQLENKHQHLAKSYTDLDSDYANLKNEVAQLRSELTSIRSSREGSVIGGSSVKQEENAAFFDPFATDGYFGAGTVSDMGF